MEQSWPAVPESVPKICEYVNQSSVDLGFAPTKARQLELAVEEVVSNIVGYAFPDGGEQKRIVVSLTRSESTLILEVKDPGIPFNPLEHPQPDLEAALEDRPIGGLGIFLVGKMVDGMSYRRDGDRNVLTLEKSF